MNFDRSKWGFSPSLMCMGYLSIEKKISLLEKEFNSFHVDIMDGHFCHSIHLSPDYIKDIFSITKLPIVVHLMVENPFDYIQQLIENGAGTIIVHIEACQTNIFRIIDAVHKAKKRVGVALCPATPVEAILHLLSYVDIVTVLNVDPGYVGQSMISEMYKKIAYIKEIKQKYNYKFIIQSDGGVCDKTYGNLIAAGTEDFVLGKKALFGKCSNLQEAMTIMLNEFSLALDGLSTLNCTFTEDVAEVEEKEFIQMI